MKILILQVGKTKEKPYQEIEAEFLKRLKPLASVEKATIETSNQEMENQVLSTKIAKISHKTKGEYFIVALDCSGKAFSSEELANFLLQKRDQDSGKIAFVIGGPHGFTPPTLQQADLILSLSKMTFTHQMVRLFLLEQMYRAFTILAHKKYHY